MGNDFQEVDYDDHSFGIANSDESFVLVQDSGVFPKVQENYTICNIGRSIVNVELWYGDEVQWFGIVGSATVYPNEKKTIDNEGKTYYYTGLKVKNNEKKRAIVHCEGGNLPSPYTPSPNIYEILEKAFLLGIKFLPYGELVGHLLMDILHLYWPGDKPDIWQQISNKIYVLLDKYTQSILKAILENVIVTYRDKISSLLAEWKQNLNINDHYLAIAYDLVGLENKFCFSETVHNYKNINVFFIPMYFTFVSLKINFYLLGIRHGKQFGLTNKSINMIQNYAYKTFQNASLHIKTIKAYAVDDTYENSEAEMIFNNMMTMRSHLALNGEEYLPIWESQLCHPLEKEIYNPVISFSTFFGKPTANLYSQATPVNVPQPLLPKMINGKRNVLKELKVYLWSEYFKIGGVKLIFENGDSYEMGTVTSSIQSVNLKDAKILELTVYGDGKIDGLKFVLSNESTHTFGQTGSSYSKIFCRQDHFIPSFYLSSDSSDLGGQAANIAVAFQWYDPSKYEVSTNCCFNIFHRNK